ncbi:glycosyltransferase family 2 protein [Anaeromyxobacter sp. Fw109-5]|uniref:glycosyltransferase n=1 Tax=Anaeromyxobacter sp. (strain Fw109-5) TaxID=404589 RepID=UPI0000ED81CA|nr:glycosyltransferase [Anaeromyxobacter sp. Fw109-5]ABS26021.1 glycosyl transferase family 2 [Anaeromyxobacter sp. Fw109-5]
MKAPTASVVIGVFNRARQIVPCLESLLASTFQDFELVLVEDASTDDSAQVLARFKAAHPAHRIRIIQNERNRGASGSRNIGSDAAEGEFLLFTDSDCIVEPTWIEEMVKAFRSSGAPAVSGMVLDKPPTNLTERAYVGSCLVVRKTPNLMESNMGYRRSLGCRLDEAIFYGEGDDLATRLRAAGHVVALAPDAVVHHQHALHFASYMRMARVAGRGHTLYWYKHGKLLGRDIMFAGLAVLSLPLGLVDPLLLAIPALCASAQVAAILFNELHYKGKPMREALAVLPVQLAYYAVRTASALRTWTRIALGRERAIGESKTRWLEERRLRLEGSAAD